MSNGAAKLPWEASLFRTCCKRKLWTSSSQNPCCKLLSRPELSAYGPKLQWLKAQMEHGKGAAQASYVSSISKELYEAFPDPVQNPLLI